jgi:4-diphosphocytidyl-2-C-methyl-D-erythritol kinase
LDGGGLGLHAPAKINLNLLVAPPGPDGFHPIDSIVAKITLYDSLEIRPRTDDRIVLDCVGADCGPPAENLVMRAAELAAEGGDVCGVDIKLIKAIPPGAGLGGGSSDAAAALIGLNELWGLRLDESVLCAMAAELGSDVPLFLGPPAVRLTGRGELVEPLGVCGFAAVIVMSRMMCSTVEVYDAYDRLGAEASEQLDVSLLAAEPPSIWRAMLRNDLAAAAICVCPELAVIRDRVQTSVDAPVQITGSGSAMFILYDDARQAVSVIEDLDKDLQDMCVIAGLSPW